MSIFTLQVSLAERSYPIHIGNGAVGPLRAEVAALREKKRKVALILDAGFAAAHPGFAASIGFERDEILPVPSGETSKSTGEFARLLSALAGRPLGRDCAVFACGGGVVGDLAGFVAASYLRGVDFYQIPTTLLAMVDSSVGGKTGINLPEGKNLVGAFWQPKAVFILPEHLQTLPARELAAGMAEVVKYGMLCDGALFEQLETGDTLTAASPALAGVIARCCELKAAVVRADEKETAHNGGRALLNLGHTFAHAVEQVAGYGDYLHGEAVAVGLVLATRLAIEVDGLAPVELERVTKLLVRYALPTRLQAPLPLDVLLAAMAKDKKNLSGKLRLISMESVGQAKVREGVAIDTIRRLWLEAGASEAK